MDLSVFVVFGSILAICMKYDPLWFYLENAYEAKSLSVSHSVHKTKVIKPGRPMIWKKKPFMSPPISRGKTFEIIQAVNLHGFSLTVSHLNILNFYLTRN